MGNVISTPVVFLTWISQFITLYVGKVYPHLATLAAVVCMM